MSTEVNPNLQLQIAHVLFIDVVGYSKLLIDDQRELQQQLNPYWDSLREDPRFEKIAADLAPKETTSK
jgi:hypothetical protein